MSAPAKMIPELEIPEGLQYLIKYCEKFCVAECCGVGAFDFSPLHVASCISGPTGAVDSETLTPWLELIDELEAEFMAVQRTEAGGPVCVIKSMNQSFTEEAFRTLVAELRTSVLAAPRLAELSNHLEAEIHAWEIIKKDAESSDTWPAKPGFH